MSEETTDVMTPGDRIRERIADLKKPDEWIVYPFEGNHIYSIQRIQRTLICNFARELGLPQGWDNNWNRETTEQQAGLIANMLDLTGAKLHNGRYDPAKNTVLTRAGTEIKDIHIAPGASIGHRVALWSLSGPVRIETEVSLGEGCHLNSCTIKAGAQLGNNVYVMAGAKIGAYATIPPFAAIHENARVGCGATVLTWQCPDAWRRITLLWDWNTEKFWVNSGCQCHPLDFWLDNFNEDENPPELDEDEYGDCEVEETDQYGMVYDNRQDVRTVKRKWRDYALFMITNEATKALLKGTDWRGNDE